MGLKSFSAVGKISSIGEVKKFNDVTYLEVSILIEPSTQILDFYLTETKDSHVLYSFIVFYLLLLVQGFFINTALKKSFARYRKFLRLKRKRANNVKKV
jgi:hypothetical protein